MIVALALLKKREMHFRCLKRPAQSGRSRPGRPELYLLLCGWRLATWPAVRYGEHNQHDEYRSAPHTLRPT
jgi:hypothetical protein